MFSKLVLINLGLLILIMFPYQCSQAGVRTVYSKSDVISPIYLKMGRSTVLRFYDRPLRGVIGNQNYFNLEFVEGSNDVTIQPTGEAETNLFIYTKNRVYGFYLKFKRGRFDDLVQVRLSSDKSLKISDIKLPRPIVKKCLKKFYARKLFSGQVDKVTYMPNLKSYIIDGKITPFNDLETTKISFLVSRNKKQLRYDDFAFKSDQIKKRSRVRWRTLIKIPSKRGISLHFNHKKRKTRVIIPRSCL